MHSIIGSMTELGIHWEGLSVSILKLGVKCGMHGTF